MGFWIYIGFYTLFMIIIWGFFIIAKIHSLKFKNYQPKIIKTTNTITIILTIFTIIGYLLIFSLGGSSNSYDISSTVKQTQEEDFSDFSEKDDNIIPENAGEDYY